ncbi:AarF/ABC1/UbiB kinase family protein [Microbacterium sp. VKM Ac-2870]|uniref:ABC1 kinase family protein n=1 Tax=Microbacterium sp. VKM Ac-2870 TaxID=2783825 RepID=UPI001889F592|nr:AarF/UbiB family protein [Microbacterium sp. VKM Ac-2870]MBF4562985.1 AarF/ABC1/UbiB kinase family protein [Microbacterium sp. VKM Ac-2870]
MAVPSGSRARYRRILRFAALSLAQTWWYDLFLPRVGLRGVAERTRSARMQRIARRFHALAVDLGGLMIKVGQFMSSRLDVLPPEITKELEGLQDEVPPVPFAEIRAAAEAQLGMPLERAYDWFDETPVAAASLGQAHRARLTPADATLSGFGAVVVKVQRPGIDEIVDVDLAALRRVAGWLSHVRLVSDRVDAPALAEEFAATSREEIDYLHEAQNAERFADEAAGNPAIAVPQVVWERSTRKVLTLEDVTAIKISDVAALRAAGIDPSEVAHAFATTMFTQLFRTGFFHADPHPGNVFVTPRPASADAAAPPWTLTFIDFGMMGTVDARLRAGLRTVLLAVTARDSKRLVQGILDVGALLPGADTRDLERAYATLFARFGGMGFAQLREVDPREFRDFAEEFGDVVRTLPFQLPENFLLIVRAMSLTSGVCSTLDAEFNIWESIEPFAGQVLRDEGGNLVKDVVGQISAVASTAWRLPQRLDALITGFEEGTVSVDMSRLERRLDRLERVATRGLSAVVFGILLIGGILLRATDEVFGVVLMAASVVPLVTTLFPMTGRRRR